MSSSGPSFLTGPVWISLQEAFSDDPYKMREINCLVDVSDRFLVFSERHVSQSPDLPLPPVLAPSETMVGDHGLNPPLSTKNPRNKGFSGSGAPIFGFGLADPAPKG